MAGLSRLFAPREREFFDLFEEAGRNIVQSGEILENMLERWPDHGELAREIVIREQEGDRITHDILDLASALDDIVDYIEEVADYLQLYRIEAPMEQAQELSRILHQACREVNNAIPRLRTFGDIRHFTVEINRLENDGDRTVRAALASLFETGIDPMMVIRWKDIFERLEEAIDATERAANILEGVMIKNR
jgi:uncharacterized protein Yka (UPF0111/DUF47 family)